MGPVDFDPAILFCPAVFIFARVFLFLQGYYLRTNRCSAVFGRFCVQKPPNEPLFGSFRT